MDANGDGIGDLQGILNKLSYLKGEGKTLGVDAIWISPFYTSPMRDFGYDISNYTEVDPRFGTLKDFDELIIRAHELGIKVMIDFVPNHSSSDHPWFQEALSNPESDKRDYYIFKPAKNGKAPNNWLSVFGGSAWEKSPTAKTDTPEYYCHSFLPEQPDLNWENPAVQQEMRDILRFWLDRGVDGLRVDAIRHMAKDPDYGDEAKDPAWKKGHDPYSQLLHTKSRYGEKLDEYLQVITDVAREYPDTLVIFEDHLDGLTPLKEQIHRLYAIDPEIAAPFNFQLMFAPFEAKAMGTIINNLQKILPGVAKPYYCFSNHDVQRIVSKVGHEQARVLTLLQLTLPGIPVLYYGQELGMEDGVIPASMIHDPVELRIPGEGLGRDPERTPMQWNAGLHAGFSEGEPWLPVTDTYQSVNVESQQGDPDSFLALHQHLLQLRSKHDVLRSEAYTSLRLDSSVFMYQRALDNEDFIVVLNFSSHPQEFSLPGDGYELVATAQSIDYTSSDRTIRPIDGMVFYKTT